MSVSVVYSVYMLCVCGVLRCVGVCSVRGGVSGVKDVSAISCMDVCKGCR